MEAKASIGQRITAAGGIFNGIWETPTATFAVVTEPASMSTTLVPILGLSTTAVETQLAAVRQRFGLSA
jgi:hypothetical protein